MLDRLRIDSWLSISHLRGCGEDCLREAQLRTSSLLLCIENCHVADFRWKWRHVSPRSADQLGIKGHDTSDSNVNFRGQVALLHHLLLLATDFWRNWAFLGLLLEVPVHSMAETNWLIRFNGALILNRASVQKVVHLLSSCRVVAGPWD